MEAAGARRTGKKRKAKAKVAANAAAKEVVVEVSTGAKPKAASVAAQSKAAKKAAASARQQTADAPAVTKADAPATATLGETALTGKKSKKKRKKKKNQAAAAAANGDQTATVPAPTESSAPTESPATTTPATTVKTSAPTKKQQPVAVTAPGPAQKRKISQITASDAKSSTIVTIGNSDKPAVSPKRKIVILNSSAKKVKLNATTSAVATAPVKSPVKKPTPVPTPIKKTASPVSTPKPGSQTPAAPMPSLVANVAPKPNATPQPVKEAIKPKELKSKQKLMRLQEKMQGPPSEKALEAQTKPSPEIAASPLFAQKTADSPTIIAAKPPADEIEKKAVPAEEIATISDAPSPELPTVAIISTKTNDKEAVLGDLPTLEDIAPEKTTENSELLDVPSLEEILPVKTTETSVLISLPSTPDGNLDYIASGVEPLDVLGTVQAISTPPFVNDLLSEDQSSLDFMGEWTDSAPSLQVEPSPPSLLDSYHTTEELERDSVSESIGETQQSDVNQSQVKREAEEITEIMTEDEPDADEPSDNKSHIELPPEASKVSDSKLQDQQREIQSEQERFLSSQQRAILLKTVQDDSTLLSALPTKQETQMWGPSFGRIQAPPPNEDTSSDILSTTPLSSWFLSKGAANFIKRVVSPARYARKSRSPEKRVRPSSAPVRQLLVHEEADEEDLTESKRNEFLESLALQPAWRSWFTNAHPAGVLDPPLTHVPASVQNHFDAIEDLTEETQAEDPSDSDKIEPKPTIETLEEDIRREKAKGKAFDQELLLMLQGRTLSGKEFAAEYAALLPTATTPT